jgi:hypothetical protein
MKYLQFTFRHGLLILSMLSLNVPGCAQDWRSITPLKTVRTEVESLLGPSTGTYHATYTLQDGVLFVEYSSGPCTPDRKGGWDVPEYTVVSVRFEPKSKKKFASLKLDLSKFKRVVGKHVGSVTYYTNEEDGITYEVQRDRVDAIEYLPGKRNLSLQCGGQKSRQY